MDPLVFGCWPFSGKYGARDTASCGKVACSAKTAHQLSMCPATARRKSRPSQLCLAIEETVILLHPTLLLAGVSIWVERGCQ